MRAQRVTAACTFGLLAEDHVACQRVGDGEAERHRRGDQRHRSPSRQCSLAHRVEYQKGIVLTHEGKSRQTESVDWRVSRDCLTP